MSDDPQPVLIDHMWFGAVPAVEAAIANRPDASMVIYDDVAYVNVRSPVPLDLPPGLGWTGPQLSRVVTGYWLGDKPDVPTQVTRFQAREALRRTPTGTEGVSLFDAVEGALQQAGGDMLNAWNDVGVFVRNSPTVVTLGQQLGLTDEQLDDLFRLAATISA